MTVLMYDGHASSARRLRSRGLAALRCWSRHVGSQVCVALLLTWGCGAPRGGEAGESTIADSGVTTAPLPDSARAPGVVGASATASPPRASRTEIERGALKVSVWRPVEPNKCDLRGNPTLPAGPGESAGTVRIYWSCDPKKPDPSLPGQPAVAARRVQVPAGGDPMRVAVAALLRGPTEEEREAGLISSFGPASSGVPFSVRVQNDGLAILDLDPAIRKVPRAFLSTAESAQIVATLGQFPGVQRVAILIGGRTLCQALGEC